ncbi:HNH endonuclease [Oxynema aestuarii AP17]|uniref:HNH endonuclease n=1 Tax=Oxynema aestuarii AP17 TaxID=2064643 RepID=A0A6H1U4D4_9CYAN|nr:HNH endonuclease [Oxynema aestuarii AP17]
MRSGGHLIRSSAVTSSITDVLTHAVVVFSKNYLPIARVNVKRAIVLLIAGKAEPLDLTGGMAAATTGMPLSKIYEVRSPSTILQVPEHIRLTVSGTERMWKVPPVNRREVLRRDRHSCQYCGSTKHLTLDHVIPKSKGGAHSWDNVVAACSACNGRKGDRTPQQAGMPLTSKPKAPMHPAIAFAEEFWNDFQV